MLPMRADFAAVQLQLLGYGSITLEHMELLGVRQSKIFTVKRHGELVKALELSMM